MRTIAPLFAVLLSACAGTTPAPQFSPRDPADPRARESAPVPFESGLDGAPAPARPEQPSGDAYACPMHPHVTQVGPGECRVCGMALVKHSSHEPRP